MQWLSLKDRLAGRGLDREWALYVCSGREAFFQAAPSTLLVDRDRQRQHMRLAAANQRDRQPVERRRAVLSAGGRPF